MFNDPYVDPRVAKAQPWAGFSEHFGVKKTRRLRGSAVIFFLLSYEMFPPQLSVDCRATSNSQHELLTTKERDRK